jgi:hypothetical protein
LDSDGRKTPYLLGGEGEGKIEAEIGGDQESGGLKGKREVIETVGKGSESSAAL